jgi:AcrR family transcriptional regulator
MGVRREVTGPRTGGRRGATYHHGNLREALLDAAERALAREGTEGLALRAIARAAGVTHAAVYHHFADREALLRAVAARGFERFAAALGAAAGGAPGEQAFQEMGVAYVRFAAEHPALFRLMFGAEAARGRGADAGLREASDAAYSALIQGVRRLLPTADEATVRRHAIRAWSLVHGLSALLLDGQLAGRRLADHEALAREILTGPG